MQKLNRDDAQSHLGKLPPARVEQLLIVADAIHKGLHGGEPLLGEATAYGEITLPEHRELFDAIWHLSDDQLASITPVIEEKRRGIQVGGQITWFEHQRRQEILARLDPHRDKIRRIAKPIDEIPWD